MPLGLMGQRVVVVGGTNIQKFWRCITEIVIERTTFQIIWRYCAHAVIKWSIFFQKRDVGIYVVKQSRR